MTRTPAAVPPFPERMEGEPSVNQASTAGHGLTIEELAEALFVAREAFCDYACHGGSDAPCIRPKWQCEAECGKSAGDAIVYIDSVLARLSITREPQEG